MVNSANELDKAFQDAFNKADGAALSALYWNSPDVASFPPDTMQARGIAAIKEAWGKAFETMKGAKLEFVEMRNLAVGDVVLGSGLWKMTMTGPDGKPAEVTGRYSDVKAERDGKWVYLMDHGSVPLPPPPAKK
jgi:ketosteroid isomerase-like protein